MEDIDSNIMMIKSPKSLMSPSKSKAPRKMTSESVWARLIRAGGSEKSEKIPLEFNLKDRDANIYIGRFPAIDDKLRDSLPFDGSKNGWKQLQIPCAFISGTHLSIHKVPRSRDDSIDDGDFANDFMFMVRDHSRNGTYINGIVIGKDNEREIFNNDKIEFLFQNDVKLSYVFLVGSETDRAIMLRNANINNEFPDASAHPHAMAKETESEYNMSKTVGKTDEFTQHIISALKTEKTLLESRVTALSTENETLLRQNHDLQQNNQNYQSKITSYDLEIRSLKQEIISMESMQHANEARIHIISNELEKKDAIIADMKMKYETLLQELEYNKKIIEMKEQSIENLESRYEQLKVHNETAESQIQYLTMKHNDVERKYQMTLADIDDKNKTIDLLDNKIKVLEDMNAKQLLALKDLRNLSSQKGQELNKKLQMQMQDIATYFSFIQSGLDQSISNASNSDNLSPEETVSQSSSPSPDVGALMMTQDGSTKAQQSRSPAVSVSRTDSVIDVSSENIPSRKTRRDEQYSDDSHDKEDGNYEEDFGHKKRVRLLGRNISEVSRNSRIDSSGYSADSSMQYTYSFPFTTQVPDAVPCEDTPRDSPHVEMEEANQTVDEKQEMTYDAKEENAISSQDKHLSHHNPDLNHSDSSRYDQLDDGRSGIYMIETTPQSNHNDSSQYAVDEVQTHESMDKLHSDSSQIHQSYKVDSMESPQLSNHDQSNRYMDERISNITSSNNHTMEYSTCYDRSNLMYGPSEETKDISLPLSDSKDDHHSMIPKDQSQSQKSALASGTEGDNKRFSSYQSSSQVSEKESEEDLLRKHEECFDEMSHYYTSAME